MRRFMIAMSIACVVSTTAVAEDIPSVGITSTKPDGAQPTSTTLPGDIPSGGSSYEITETALDLVQMLIGIAT